MRAAMAAAMFTLVAVVSASGPPPVQAYAIDHCWANGFRDGEDAIIPPLFHEGNDISCFAFCAADSCDRGDRHAAAAMDPAESHPRGHPTDLPRHSGARPDATAEPDAAPDPTAACRRRVVLGQSSVGFRCGEFHLPGSDAGGLVHQHDPAWAWEDRARPWEGPRLDRLGGDASTRFPDQGLHREFRNRAAPGTLPRQQRLDRRRRATASQQRPGDRILRPLALSICVVSTPVRCVVVCHRSLGAEREARPPHHLRAGLCSRRRGLLSLCERGAGRKESRPSSGCTPLTLTLALLGHRVHSNPAPTLPRGRTGM